MKPFKWIKKHPIEAALIGAAIVGTGGAAAGMFGPAAAGAGAVAGDAFLPGALAGTEGLAGGSSALLGGLSGFFPDMGTASLSSNLLAPMTGAYDALPAGVTGFAPGAATAAPGMAGAYGPTLAEAGSKPGWKLGGKDALLLAQMMGGGQQEQRPMGAPVDMGNPMQRQAMLTQEQITKKWLLQNDPTTYARIYGSPQGASYG